jgi:hypothetical protein
MGNPHKGPPKLRSCAARPGNSAGDDELQKPDESIKFFTVGCGLIQRFMLMSLGD